MILQRYRRHAKGLTPQEALAALWRVTSRTLFHSFDRVYVRLRADGAARRAVTSAGQGPSGNWSYGESNRRRAQPRFFAGAAQPVCHNRALERLQPASERLRRRRFDVLGTEIEFDDEVHWNIEPATGCIWPTGEYHVDFLHRLGERREYGDVRRTWELNRFLHIPLLGRVRCLSERGNDWCASEFVAQVESWIRANPYGRGPNWASTMDVAIRMINFIWGYWLFREDRSIPDLFWRRLTETIWQHARHIERHPQGAAIPDNHHVSHFLGLFYVGLLFPQLPRASRWLALGRAGLVEQMRRQVYDDGVQHECTTNYQKLVAEMFLHGLLLADRNNCPFPAPFREKLARMFGVLWALEQPDGLTPIFGDADNGRLQDVACADAPNDYRPLLTAAAVALERPDLFPRGGSVWELAYTLCGWVGNDAGAAAANAQAPFCERATASVASFPDGGFFTVRSGNAHLVVRGGPFGLRGHGGHSHNDQLAFVYWHGRPVFVDPGILGYAGLPPALIEYFRSTAAHNTLCVDGTDQLPVSTAGSERPRYSPYAKRPNPQVIEEPTKDCRTYRLLLEHYYYHEIGVVHRRAFELDDGGRRFRITDCVQGDGEHNLTWSFHLATGLAAARIAVGVAVRAGDKRIGVLRVADGLLGGMDITPTPRAAGYGSLSCAPTIRLQAACALPLRAEFVFECSAAT